MMKAFLAELAVEAVKGQPCSHCKAYYTRVKCMHELHQLGCVVQLTFKRKDVYTYGGEV